MTPAPSPSVIKLAEVTSTNSYLSAHPERSTLPHGTVVATTAQTAGRGQRGNTWEAEPGKNVTMSILLRPRQVEASRQFVISEAVSVALVRLLRRYIKEGERVKIKWPNDIYVDNFKICGILIEHTLSGRRIESTVAGIGLNVNQTTFVSDAPNPISLKNITGDGYDIDCITVALAQEVLNLMAQYDTLDAHELHEIYLDMLWRKDTEAHYIDAATGEMFTGRITGVDPDGQLHIQPSTPGSNERTYAFKEVQMVV